jgi:hypothetical protein
MVSGVIDNQPKILNHDPVASFFHPEHDMKNTIDSVISFMAWKNRKKGNKKKI